MAQRQRFEATCHHASGDYVALLPLSNTQQRLHHLLMLHQQGTRLYTEMQIMLQRRRQREQAVPPTRLIMPDAGAIWEAKFII